MTMRYNEEHAFIRIGKDLKAGRIPGLVLLLGVERYLVDFYSETLIKKYVNEATKSLDLVTLDRERLTSSDVIANLETIPLMSDRKVVYIPSFINEKGKLPAAFSDSEELGVFLDYIKNIPEGTLLLLSVDSQEDSRAESSIRSSKAFKAISSAGKIYDFDRLNQGQLRGFIEKRLNVSGKKYRTNIPDTIARESGYGNKSIDYDLYTLNNDLKKIIAYADEEITMADLSQVIARSPENNVFAMIDAIGKNRKDEAFRLMNNLLQDGSNEFQLLSLITKQLELMLMSAEMKSEGMSLAGIQDNLKKIEHVPEYRAKKALEIGNYFRISDLKRILSSAYNVDNNIKSGLMPAQLALEFFIAGI